MVVLTVQMSHIFASERSSKMNIAKTALVTVILLCMAVLAGCNEGQARYCDPAGGGPLALVQSQTGYWQPHVGSPGSW